MLLGVAVTVAQGPTPQDPRSAQDVLGTSFTYQGRLQKGDSPVDGSCEMAFRLYDAAELGEQACVSRAKRELAAKGALMVRYS